MTIFKGLDDDDVSNLWNSETSHGGVNECRKLQQKQQQLQEFIVGLFFTTHSHRR